MHVCMWELNTRSVGLGMVHFAAADSKLQLRGLAASRTLHKWRRRGSSGLVDLTFRAAAAAASRWRCAFEAERKLSMSTAMETWAGSKQSQNVIWCCRKQGLLRPAARAVEDEGDERELSKMKVVVRIISIAVIFDGGRNRRDP